MTDVVASGGSRAEPRDGTWCSRDALSRGEPMAGSAPVAHTWIAVEQPGPWGSAPLARSGHGVRVVMVRGPRVSAGGVSDRSAHTAAGESGGTGVRVWVAHVGAEPVLRRGNVADPGVVAGWDLAAVAAGSLREWAVAEPEPLLLVCANGRRDRCCGHTGGRLAEELWRGENRSRVLTSTHLGGHRFAPTALLLPTGALHGRLDPVAAASLVDGAGAGRMAAGTLRGFSSLSEPAQVAEARARLVSGHTGTAPLRVELRPGADSDHTIAHVELPAGSSPAVLQVPLRRASISGVRSCGKGLESATRWTLA